MRYLPAPDFRNRDRAAHPAGGGLLRKGPAGARKIPVLYVDDDPALLAVIRLILERTGLISVTVCGSGREALALMERRRFDVVVSDYDMPEMDGLALLARIRASGNRVPFILFTGRQRRDLPEDGPREPEFTYVGKSPGGPGFPAELPACVCRLAKSCPFPVSRPCPAPVTPVRSTDSGELSRMNSRSPVCPM